MRSNLLLLVLFSLMIISCKKDSNTDPIIDTSGTYIHLFFETEQECIDWQPYPDFEIACFQSLKFSAGNKVQIMVTDIVWTGTYSMKSDTVVCAFTDCIELPATVKFLAEDRDHLVESTSGTVWKRQVGETIWELAE